jgi:GxxExxY protein
MEKAEMTYAIIGAAMQVHSRLGPGHFEAVYHEGLEIEFQTRQLPYRSKPRINILYKGRLLNKHYVPDFLVFGCIVVEIKASTQLCRADEIQVVNSLKSSELGLGLLINFGETSLRWRRFVCQPNPRNLCSNP